MVENKDGRIVLIYPLLDKVMVGTSDLPVDDPDEARCTEDEIKYFFEMVPIVFPGINLDHSQIVYQFSGVRPLPYMDANTAGQISRDHSVEVIEPGQDLRFPVYNLIGGKWTSFRAFSQEVTDLTLKALDLDRKIDTRDLAIGGGREYPRDKDTCLGWVERQAAKTSIPVQRMSTLFDRYGTRAAAIAEYIITNKDLELRYIPEFTQREVEYLTLNEKINHIDDFFLRRSMLAKRGHLTLEAISEVTEIIGDALDWSHARKDREIKRTRRILEEFHGISF
jgi:glycerol-3-phosphate dehydrogenase